VEDRFRLTVVVPLTGVLSLESKDGLAHRCQLDAKKKNASFESKHEKHIVFAGIRAIKVYVLGTTGCRATAT
jgi:hypothetical protein